MNKCNFSIGFRVLSPWFMEADSYQIDQGRYSWMWQSQGLTACLGGWWDARVDAHYFFQTLNLPLVHHGSAVYQTLVQHWVLLSFRAWVCVSIWLRPAASLGTKMHRTFWTGDVCLILPPLPALQGGWVSLPKSYITLGLSHHIRVAEGLLRAASLLSHMLLSRSYWHVID